MSTFPSQSAPSRGRYEPIRTLGQGGAGIVTLVLDRESGTQIALKKLLRIDPKSVLRLKREFRSLAELHHRNLVKYYDLHSGDDGWSVTMEYVDGPDLLAYAGQESEAESRDITTTRELSASPLRRRAPDLEHALGAFHQLATGVRALHAAGMLHRDLKPSNVLVESGRVVVLDFGLVRDLHPQDPDLTQDGMISGTPAYMAPEQGLGRPLDEAADWYAFGVMLYQALAGQLPIDGRTPTELLLRKASDDPLPIERVVPQLPNAVASLVNSLLSREPGQRPSGEDVLRVLAQRAEPAAGADDLGTSLHLTITTQTQSARPVPGHTLVGRENALDQLERAFQVARREGAVVAHVRGRSGAGKTTLVQRFADRLERELSPLESTSPPIVLRSRCYEREAMPFKALDGIMDALMRHLLERSDFELGRLLPLHVPELAQLFPVLQRILGIQRLLETSKPHSDALQARVRGEAALRELFARLSAERPVVVWIDDLQWGDLDSATILRQWPEQLASAPVLLVFSYRSDEVDTSPCLRMLLESRGAEGAGPAIREELVELGALTDDEVRLLCERRLGSLALAHPGLIDSIARESQGNPFLASQLSALMQARVARGERHLDAVSIEQLIEQSTTRLPEGAVRTLNVLAIAGRPLAARHALRAAGVGREGRALLHSLGRLRLIRTRDDQGVQLIEVYHDRVREGVQAALGAPERVRVHAALLAELERAEYDDPDWLHELACGAGERPAAFRYGMAAAERADSALAFERAAELYRSCIALHEGSTADGVKLRLRMAEALARSGRGVPAAEALLDVARVVAASETVAELVAACLPGARALPVVAWRGAGMAQSAAVRCMRYAASHLLRSGEYARGEAIVHQVLDQLGQRMPATDAGMLARLLWERSVLAVRGLEFQRSEQPLDSEQLELADFYGALSIEYQPHDPLRAGLFQVRCLRAVLATGNPARVARALCAAATMACVGGSARAAREADALLERAGALANELGIDSVRADVLASRAVCSYLLGRSTEVIEASYEAERMQRSDPRAEATGSYYHRFVVLAARIGALNNVGEHRRATEELERALGEARRTHNRSALLQLTLCQTYRDCLLNQAEHSKARLRDERKQLPPGRFGPLHALHMIAVMRTASSTHDYAWADAWVEEDWARWLRSPVRMSAFLNLMALGARVRFLLNRHVIERRTDDPAALVRAELRGLRRLPWEDWRTGSVARAQARLALLRRDRAAAVEHLRRATACMENSGHPEWMARDRFALGVLLGGDEGRQLREEGERRLREMGLADPLADLYANYPELMDAWSG